MVMINRSAFAALKGILCHFPGGRGRKKLWQKKKEGEESEAGGGKCKKKEMWEGDIKQFRDIERQRVEVGIGKEEGEGDIRM